MTLITVSFSLVALGLFVGAIYYIAKGKMGVAAILAIAAFVVGGGVGILNAV